MNQKIKSQKVPFLSLIFNRQAPLKLKNVSPEKLELVAKLARKAKTRKVSKFYLAQFGDVLKKQNKRFKGRLGEFLNLYLLEIKPRVRNGSLFLKQATLKKLTKKTLEDISKNLDVDVAYRWYKDRIDIIKDLEPIQEKIFKF